MRIYQSFRSKAGSAESCRWSALPSKGGLIGLGITLALVAIALLLGIAAVSVGAVSPPALLLGLLALLFLGGAWYVGELTVGFYRLTYELSERLLTVRCGWRQENIPLHEVKTVQRGRDIKPPRLIHGIRWPGYNLSKGYLRGLGEVRFCTTAEFADSILVCLDRRVYAISPAHGEEFVAALRERCSASSPPDGLLGRRTSRASLPSLGLFLSDSTARTLFVSGLVLNVFLFAILAFAYGRLPGVIPVHFNSLGQADIIGESYQIFKLPAIGLFIWTGNAVLAILLHRTERAISYLLLAAAGLAQVIFWGAAAAVLV